MIAVLDRLFKTGMLRTLTVTVAARRRVHICQGVSGRGIACTHRVTSGEGQALQSLRAANTMIQRFVVFDRFSNLKTGLGFVSCLAALPTSEIRYRYRPI